MRDPQDAHEVQKWIEDRRVTHFLKNLDPEFESRRAAFCHQESLPTMEEAVSAMVIEESRLRMMSSNNPVKSAYTSVAERKCYNCGEEGHLSYNCPLPKSYGSRSGSRGGRGGARGDQGSRGGRGGGRGRGRGGTQANVANWESGSQITTATAGDFPSVTLTGEQVKQWEEWQKMKGSESSKTTSDGPMIATTSHFGNFANYAHLGKGTQAQALASTYRHGIEWIIDSGASKHVIGISSSFKTYTPHSYSETIQTADGTSQSIHGVGSVECTPSLYLSSVLHVPSFPVNLLSVSSLVDQFKCIVIFDENICIFQEKGTGRVIGTGIRHGLWIINQQNSALATVVGAQEREIYLLHCRLGHVPEHVELSLAQSRETRSNFGKPPVRYGFEHLSTDHDIANFLSYSHLSPAYRAFIASLQTVPILRDWKCAKQDPKWKAAMEEEMHALQKNKTWELVPLPKGKRAVGCKWVFTVKQNPKGEVDRYKARLVAKGYSQTYGIDYDETFAPVAKMGTVRTLISCAVNFGWPLHQMDVKNAFLHGDLQEEVYMEIPPGFANNQTAGKVCRLKKSLYGLKQSPRAWFDRFRRAVCGMGYTQCNGDHTVFYKHRGSFITVMAVYVDDIVITGDDVEEIRYLKENLGKAFEVKDLGPLKYFLGIEIARSPKGIVLSQRKYVLDLLTETGMLGCRPSSTPIDRNHQISAESRDSFNKETYQRLVGRLIYLCHTRPDISYAVSVVSRYMHDPRTGHMELVHRILRYLKGTPGRGLWFKKNMHLDLEGFCDADWASSRDDRRSTSGYCVFVGGNLVSWRSKKQAVVARSTAEAEYRAMALSLCEMLWLKDLLKELRVLRNETMMLHCDNVAAINIANNPVQFDRTKHVEIDRFFIKEKLDSGALRLEYVKSRSQLADCFTKGLGPSENELSCNKMGMIDIFGPS